MPWQAPQFVEIEMNAEIGAYQRDPLNEADCRQAPKSDGEAHGGTAAPESQQDAAPGQP